MQKMLHKNLYARNVTQKGYTETVTSLMQTLTLNTLTEDERPGIVCVHKKQLAVRDG